MTEEFYSLAEDWRARKIFEYLKNNSPVSLEKLSNDLKISKDALMKRIREMGELKIVEIKRAIEFYEEVEKWKNPSKIFIFLKEGNESKKFEKILNVYKIRQENPQFYI
ncbi:MAG: hypothetical protein QXP77_02300 [Candidatus Aenigmatarchaeota archaeon]